MATAYRGFRTALAKANPTDSINVLVKLVRSGFFEEAVFRELVSTPRMKELLNSGRAGVVEAKDGGLEPRIYGITKFAKFFGEIWGKV